MGINLIPFSPRGAGVLIQTFLEVYLVPGSILSFYLRCDPGQVTSLCLVFLMLKYGDLKDDFKGLWALTFCGVSGRESPGVGVRFRIFFGHLFDLGQLTSHLWGLYSNISLTDFYIKRQVGKCFEIFSGAVGEGGITIYSFPWNLSEKQAFHHPHSSESLCLGLWPQQKGLWQVSAPGHGISALIAFEPGHFSLSPLLLPWSKHPLL